MPDTREAADTLPLDAVRVLDCTRLFPFAYTTQLFLDLGAEVVKVEPPGGEPGRQLATHFAMTNRGKRSVVVDLRTESGRDEFRRLAKTADVVVESFRPDVLPRLNLGYEDLHRINTQLILCSITGYGQSGPYRERPGHDLNYYALSGALWPQASRPPQLPAVPVVDMAVAHFAAYCVSAALLHAARTGRGRHLDIAMSDLALSLNTSSVAFARGAPGAGGVPWPEFVSGEVPCYGIWETADGQWVSLGNFEPKFWLAFLDEIGHPELADDQYATGVRAEEIRTTIAAAIRKRTAEQWSRAFAGLDVCFAPVHTTEQALADPHQRARGVVRSEGGDVQVAFPPAFGAATARDRGRLPEPGEADTELLDRPRPADQDVGL